MPQANNNASLTAVKPDEVFDNLPAIIGRKPKRLADFSLRTRRR